MATSLRKGSLDVTRSRLSNYRFNTNLSPSTSSLEGGLPDSVVHMTTASTPGSDVSSVLLSQPIRESSQEDDAILDDAIMSIDSGESATPLTTKPIHSIARNYRAASDKNQSKIKI